MATARTLSSPPISEALVDIQAAVVASPEAFEALGKEFKSEYPRADTRRIFQAELKVEHGRLLPPVAKDLGFQGVWLFNSDETAVVQFRPNGLTLNNLKKYIGGDRLIDEALTLWSRFSERLQPTPVMRIALRYINRLELPFRPGDGFDRFLTAAPPVPPEAPQSVSEFLSRVVTQEPTTEATVIITQQLTHAEPNSPLVVIDVDTFKSGTLSTDPCELRKSREQLRLLKNRTFFSLLTEEAVKLYV